MNVHWMYVHGRPRTSADLMPLFSPAERRTVKSVAQFAACNPFVPEFVDRERVLLGPDHAADRSVWNLRAQPEAEDRALAMVGAIAERAARDARERLRRGPAATRPRVRPRWLRSQMSTSSLLTSNQNSRVASRSAAEISGVDGGSRNVHTSRVTPGAIGSSRIKKM